MANNLPNASNYTTFAYHTNLLADFVKNTQSATASTAAGAGGNRLRRGSTRSAGGGSMRNLGSSFRNKGRLGRLNNPTKGLANLLSTAIVESASKGRNPS